MVTQINVKPGRLSSRRVQRVCQVLVFGTLVFVGGALGCSPRYDDMPAYWPFQVDRYDHDGPGRFKTALLANQIDQFYKGSAPGPIGVTSFVNVDDLYSSSTFGRMVGEQLMSELAMKGFDVIELRQADALQFLERQGEFALSRDASIVRPERNLAGLVVGTYVNSPERVYVNARLIDPSTSVVLSAGSVEMAKTAELNKLLRGGSMPTSLERIPVRHLGRVAKPIDPSEVNRKRWDEEESSSWTIPSPQSAPQVQLPPPVASAPVAALPPLQRGDALAPLKADKLPPLAKEDVAGPQVKVE